MTFEIVVPGPLAEDKDWARECRLGKLLPALHARMRVRIDFSCAQLTTQSFVHALLAEAVQRYGQPGLDNIEFKHCNAQVREAIQTVAAYSLRARALASQLDRPSRQVESPYIPQADDLRKVRYVVDTIADGPVPLDVVSALTGYSIRHAHYRANAAHALGLLEFRGTFALITDRGKALAKTLPDSQDEISVLRDAYASSPLGRLVPTLLHDEPPTQEMIVDVYRNVGGLSLSTAVRRAKCLLSWRRQLVPTQPSLPGLTLMPTGRKSTRGR